MRKLTTTTTEAQLRDWIADGETAPQIAARLGVHTNYVYVTLALLGLSKAPCSDVDLMHEGIKAGKTAEQVGAELGMTGSGVRRALKRAGLPTCALEYLRAQQQHVSPSAEGLPAGRMQAVGGPSIAGAEVVSHGRMVIRSPESANPNRP